VAVLFWIGLGVTACMAPPASGNPKTLMQCMSFVFAGTWMAWTWQSAFFFAVIATLLTGMTIWELARPGGAPRQGILGLDTTRGDRLFISLLGSAYIHLAWLALVSAPLWGALIVSLVFSIVVFRYV
jgi:predicted small integral membrane protein